MADLTFNTTAGQTIEREKLVCYMNTGTTSTPVWSPLGKRVADSTEAYDWSEETSMDILGVSRTTLRTPQLSQTFDPVKLDSEDSPAIKVWNIAIKDRNAKGLTNFDLLIVHLYAGTANTAVFAERYGSCAVYPSGIGGSGGGDIEMPLEVRFGGTRTVGTAAISNGTVTFTAG